MKTILNQPDRANEHAFLASSLILNKKDGFIWHVPTDEYLAATQIIDISTVMKKIIRSKEELYFITTNRNGENKKFQATKLGHQFLFIKKYCLVKENYPRHKFNPFLALYFKVAQERQFYFSANHSRPLTGTQVIEKVNCLNACVDAIRQEGQSQDFIRRCESNIRSVRKNTSSLVSYCHRLRDKYADLIVFRLDLTYKKTPAWPHHGVDIVEAGEFRAHRDAFVKTLARVVAPNLLAGYIWKLEYGKQKSFNIHTVIFLKKSIFPMEIIDPKIIGQHWEKVITQGKGLYFNCNFWKEDHFKGACANSTLSSNDANWEIFEDKVISYITHPDLHASVVFSGHGRIFGKGNRPKLDPVKKGRPRTSSIKNLSALPQ